MHDPLTVVNALASLGTSLLRVDRGVIASGHRERPVMTLELFEAEYCPFCRHVREALTELDLDAMIYPIPKNGKRYRKKLESLGGEGKVPFLHDPNTGVKMGDSKAIVEYLYEQYAREGDVAPPRRILTSTAASLTRGKSGMFSAPSKAACKPLELYSFEGSPYSRLAREVFCELEIKYLLHNVGKSPGSHADYYPPEIRFEKMHDYTPRSENRRKFLERAGRVMVPYIVDPNTGTDMFQTKDIKEYLRNTYAV